MKFNEQLTRKLYAQYMADEEASIESVAIEEGILPNTLGRWFRKLGLAAKPRNRPKPYRSLSGPKTPGGYKESDTGYPHRAPRATAHRRRGRIR